MHGAAAPVGRRQFTEPRNEFKIGLVPRDSNGKTKELTIEDEIGLLGPNRFGGLDR
jgi:hypothetical protein